MPGGAVERVKILDFGIARRFDAPRHMTRTGLVVGTPEYMAPEQARGAKEITPAADIFSVGCILYQCLTGQPPFAADHLAAVLMRVLFEDPPPIEERRPGLPPSLVDLLKKMLAKDPTQRPADGAALRAAVLSSGVGEESAGALPQTAISIPHSRPRSVFADSEQGLLSVVLAAPPASSDEAIGALCLELAQKERLLAELQSLGVRAEFLASEALVVAVSQMGSATDQATLAARAALLIKKRWPQAVVSLATGRGALQGHTVLGEVVNRAEAFRSEEHAAKTPPSDISGIWLDKLSARLLKGRFAQTLQTGGALLLFEEAEPDSDRRIFGLPTPCVGREVELGLLESQLTTCMEESEARVMLITAPSGAGKSRLLREFLRRLSQREDESPLTVLQGRGELSTAGAPYALIGQLLRGYAGLAVRASLEEKREQLAVHIGRYLSESNRQHVVEFMGELCDISFPAAKDGLLHVARKDPRIMHEQLRDAFGKWLQAVCKKQSVLLILEDLQWGDALSIALLDETLHTLRSSPLFLLALARPEVRNVFPKLWAGHHLQDIPLKPLGRKACERLVQHVLGKTASPTAVQRIVQQSAGNAFFLEELIRSAKEGHSDGANRTVLAMLQARIGRFDPGPRRVLRAASIFGQRFWRGGVAELLGMAGDDLLLEHWLGALVDAEMIEPHAGSRLANEQEFGFRHALVRDAAYELLADSDLIAGHRLAASYLDRMGEPEALVLAEHFRLGGEPERAIDFYLRASAHTARMGALLQARQHCEQAKQLLNALPDDAVRSRLHIDILVRLIQLSLRSDPPKENLARLDEAKTLLWSLRSGEDPQRSDEKRRAWIEFLSGRIAYYQGSTAEALLSYQRVLPAAESLGDEQILAVASMYLGGTLMAQGQMGKCQPILARAVELEERLDGEGERIRAFSYYAISLVATGCYTQGMALHEQALLRAARNANPTQLTIAYLYHCLSMALCGDFAALLAHAQLALAHAQKSDEKLYRHTVLSLIGRAQGMLGNIQDARTSRAEAALVEQELGGRLLLSDWFAAADAEIALRAGEIPLAVQIVQEFVPTWRREQRLLALGLAEQVWGLGLGCAEPADATEADAHLQAGLDIMESSQQILAAARLRLEWAHLCLRRGHLEQAQTLRAQAVAQFQASGCAHLVEGIERAIAFLPASKLPNLN